MNTRSNTPLYGKNILGRKMQIQCPEVGMIIECLEKQKPRVAGMEPVQIANQYLAKVREADEV